MKATCIEWDKEGLDVNLPDEIEIPDDIEEDDFDAIDDYISDQTGFCHFGYVLEDSIAN